MDLHEEAGKENEQTLAKMGPAEEATSNDEVDLSLFLCFLVWLYNKHLNNLGRWYRPRCVRSVLATAVNILPYRPPARLIRGEYDLLPDITSSY